jgi:hypothetical protein
VARNRMRQERRTQNIQSLVYGVIYRRRYLNRRTEDDQVFITDLHDARVSLIALAILVMSAMDALFTLNILSLGGEEVNPGMKLLLDKSTATFLVVKYFATSIGVVLLLLFERVRIGGVLSARQILNGLCLLYGALIIYHIFLIVIATST